MQASSKRPRHGSLVNLGEPTKPSPSAITAATLPGFHEASTARACSLLVRPRLGRVGNESRGAHLHSTLESRSALNEDVHFALQRLALSARRSLWSPGLSVSDDLADKREAKSRYTKVACCEKYLAFSGCTLLGLRVDGEGRHMADASDRLVFSRIVLKATGFPTWLPLKIRRSRSGRCRNVHRGMLICSLGNKLLRGEEDQTLRCVSATVSRTDLRQQR